MKKTLWR